MNYTYIYFRITLPSLSIVLLPTSLQIYSVQDFDFMFQLSTRQFLKTKELLKDEKDHQPFFFFSLIECKTQSLPVLKISGTLSKQISQDIFTACSNKTLVSQKVQSHSVRRNNNLHTQRTVKCSNAEILALGIQHC